MASRPRIGIDARFYRSATGGIGRYSQELIRGLAAKDDGRDYVVMLTEADRAEWAISSKWIEPIFTTIEPYSKREQGELPALLKSLKLDLVHFLNFNHPLMFRDRFVLTLHDLTLLHHPTAARAGRVSLLKQFAFKQVLRHGITGAKKVIAVSKYTADDAAKTFGVPRSHFEVIYHGIPEKTPLLPQLKVTQFLGSDAPYILFLSNWRPHKGILTLAEAFALLKSKHSLPHKLVLTGNQDAASPEIRAAIDANPFRADIITPGFVPEALLGTLYGRAAAYVMPSDFEGFGLPVLEALVQGTPTIVAENSSLPEVGGPCVLKFPTRDAAALALQLETILTDSAIVETLRAQIPEHLKQFSWAKAVAQTRAVYDSVL